MKFNFLKKTLGSILILSFILPSIFVPSRANALFGAGDVVTDPGNTAGTMANLVENALNAVASAADYVTNYLMEFKEYVLDTLVHTLIQQIIRQLGQSVINWINSGFEGSPAFVQDPGAFFLDLADQMTGEFIAGADGPLQSLCSPFSIDLKIALAFKYHPKNTGRYACTLSTIIKNSENAVKNASINGFTAGDFRQGGWPAFVSMTTEPQNNIYGAYMQTDSELSFRVAGIQTQKKEELIQGGGFLSYPDPSCTKAAKQAAATTNAVVGGGEDSSALLDTDPNLVKYNESKKLFVANTASCPIVTPGSQISDTLKKNVAAGSDASVAADEIGEIIDALIAQLATQILQAGLKSISQKDSSGNSYYENTTTALEDQKALEELKASSLSKLPEFLGYAVDYKKSVDDSLTFVNGITTTYESAKACYETKLAEAASSTSIYASSTLSTYEIETANARIQNIITILAGDLAATTTRLSNKSVEVQYRIDTFNQIQASTTAAKTVLEMQGPIQQYTSLIRNGEFINMVDVKNSKQDYTALQESYANYKQDATNKLVECQGFPNNLRAHGY